MSENQEILSAIEAIQKDSSGIKLENSSINHRLNLLEFTYTDKANIRHVQDSSVTFTDHRSLLQQMC